MRGVLWFIINVAVIFGTSAQAQASDADEQMLFLSVYYESNCPDSKSFIVHQLRPALRLLHHHVFLQLVPFGKSRSVNNGNGGFECQHGPSECLGNRVQDCTLYKMLGRPDVDRLEYVVCEMQTGAGSKGRYDCVRQAQAPLEEVNKCVKSIEGTDLQLGSEYLTSLLRPTFVPTVTVNGVFNQQIQDNAQVDLIGTLCSLLQNSRECAQYYNQVALNELLTKPLAYEQTQ